MADNYIGWKLFDKVTIVAKKMYAYDYKTSTTYETGTVQGYLVDPSNKKQLENARSWGTTHTYEYFTDEKGNRSVKQTHEHKPEEYTYDNDGFMLQLYNSAEGSSQGGKLSFWNCWITAPDGKKFLIGIAADLLLDVLKSSIVVNGIVLDKLMFARCKGGVGMLHKGMESYQQAIADANTRNNMKKGKTSKHQLGHVYVTATEQNVYFGKFYRWYEPVYEKKVVSWGVYRDTIVGFKKLDKPVEQIFFPRYDETKTKFSEYECHWWECRDKAPARRESDSVVEIDLTPEEMCKRFEEQHFWRHYNDWFGDKKYAKYICSDAVGLSSNNTEYTMPQDLRNALNRYGYYVED